MCQFRSCQRYGDTSHELFKPISSETAATVRAGWWAYHLDSGGGQPHSSSYPSSGTYSLSPSPSYPSSVASRHADEMIPTYDYGYGSSF